jgi:hypothetical protein
MKLKKGTYYVGDPCYIFGKSWSDFLNMLRFFGDCDIVKVFGEECIAGRTAYGDGSYFDNFGRKYCVDSGLVGILPISLIDKDRVVTLEKIEESKCMHIIDFSEDFEVSIYNGVFNFGNVIINTGG